MAQKTKKEIIVELYELPISNRKNDHYGRVVNKKKLTEKDLIAIAVKQGTDLRPATMEAVLDILKKTAMEQIADGASVTFGLSHYKLIVSGVFMNGINNWDEDVNSLNVQINPTQDLREYIKTTTVNMRGNAQVGACINTVTDCETLSINSKLTPGGLIRLEGTRMKIEGDSPENGIRLINRQTGEIILIPANFLAHNAPKKITFLLPDNIPSGEYTISITTQYTNGTILRKLPQSRECPYILVI